MKSNDKSVTAKIQRVDQGRGFGNFGAEAQRLFVDETKCHIASLCQYVRASKSIDEAVEIADVGGGNGLLAKAVLQELGSEYLHLTIDLLDIDDSKFPNGEPRISYLHHDARTPLGKHYDGLIARSMLHYNTPAEQKRIIQELAHGAKPKGLVTIVQPTPTSRGEKAKINGLYDLLCGLKGSNKKHWLTLSEIIQRVEEAGLEIQQIESVADGSYTLNGFYRKRYDLSDEETARVQQYLAGEESVYLPTRVIVARKS